MCGGAISITPGQVVRRALCGSLERQNPGQTLSRTVKPTLALTTVNSLDATSGLEDKQPGFCTDI